MKVSEHGLDRARCCFFLLQPFLLRFLFWPGHGLVMSRAMVASLLGFCLTSVFVAPGSVIAQVDRYLQYGEFSLALEQTHNLPPATIDPDLKKIAFAQMMGGAANGAWQTANQIGSGPARNDALGGMFNPGAADGSAGGVTEADFQPLIDLIQSTIAPDEWSDTGQGDGTIQPWPAGVYVDATGTLRRLRTDGTGQLGDIRRWAAQEQPGFQSTTETELRAISLVQLERSSQFFAAQRMPLTPWMKNLGGLYAIKYLVAVPERKDILLVGPAGPWTTSSEGIALNAKTGLPVLQLDDLVVCLRNIREHRGIFGCSITPRQENLAAAKGFLATSKLTGANWREGLRAQLGQQDVEVFGIAADTHMASVLVEADYRMKLVGMGIEPSISEVPSYLDRVELLPDGSAPPLDVARWWFTLNYDDLAADRDRLVFAFQGTGVKVLSETEFINTQGERIHTGQSLGPTKEFAEDFTQHFEKLARKYPIYAQLRGVFDLALVAAILDREKLDQRVGWEATFFGISESKGALTYQTAHNQVAHQVDSIMNHRLMRGRQNGRAVQHTIVGVSGGIHCDCYDFLKSSLRPNSLADSTISEVRQMSVSPTAPDAWWWD